MICHHTCCQNNIMEWLVLAAVNLLCLIVDTNVFLRFRATIF